LNTSLWISELSTDIDKEFLTDGLTYGFQLLPHDAKIQAAEMHNYHSVTNPTAKGKVEAIIREELVEGNYCITPFKPTIVSALGAVPKSDSSELRLIHDCSMPKGLGVNSYIDIEKQSFSTIQSAVKLISKGCYMAKVDLRHAYRSVPVHPSNYTALGLKWKFDGDTHDTYFVDTRFPFGTRSSPGIFHRLTQSVKRMMIRRGFTGIVVYLDDFLVVGDTKESCQKAYDTLCLLLLDLGFTLSASKLVPPSQCLVFLGVELDSLALSLSLPASKLNDLKSVLASFHGKPRATKHQLQRLAGKLNWACKVVYGGRTFLRRILDLMNTLPLPASRCRLTSDFHRDIQWWEEFLEVFNGKCNFLDDRPVTSLETDACSSAVGAFYEGDWFYSNLVVDSPQIASLHINFKEALCVVLAAVRWGHLWRDKLIYIYCDNTTAVALLNKGTTRNPFVMQYLRLLFWLSAVYNFRLKVCHIPGALNSTADAISRLHERRSFWYFYSLLCSYISKPCLISCLSHMSILSYYFLLGKAGSDRVPFLSR